MRDVLRRVPTISNPLFGSITVDHGRGESADAMMTRLAAEGEAQAREACLTRIHDLLPRYQAARDALLGLKPSEKVGDFGNLPVADMSRQDLERLEEDRMKFVERLEQRVLELDRERIASMSQIDRLTLALTDALGRIARLERLAESRAGSSSEPLTAVRRSRADVPQLLVPGQGGQAAGLGSVSGAFGSPPRIGGGVRRVGS